VANGFPKILASRVPLDAERLAAFGRKRKVRELALFGSVLRDDFGPESDVDVLISFEPEARWSLHDLFDIKAELEALFGRSVDLVEREALKNPFRRHEILTTARTVYAA
jgi:uncharacterized protein